MKVSNKKKNLSKSSKCLNISLLNAAHPHGIEPLGNMFLNGDKNIRFEGLGELAVLSDFTITEILEFLEGEDLLELLLVSKTFYAFASYDDLWMQLMIKNWEEKKNVSFSGSWRDIWLNEKYKNNKIKTKCLKKKINLRGLYSDFLYQKFYCSFVEINPSWLRVSNVPRVDAAHLTVDEFIQNFQIPNKPVIITGIVDKWPAYANWNRKYLQEATEGKTFAAGPVNITLKEFFEYSDKMRDESPLFVFDPHFCEGISAQNFVDDFSVPKYFQSDFFQYLKKRPNFRWIILGGKRSGSKWHIDPNCTHAWNAVIKGKKRWIFLPREIVPPGVYPSTDMSEVIQPLSLIEWYLNFYRSTQSKDFFQTYGMYPYECTVSAGEVIFVPRESWHMVMNLEEDTFAITQNFVDKTNVQNVRNFLHFKQQQISGVEEERKSSLAFEFEEALAVHFPEVLIPLVNPSLPDTCNEKNKHKNYNFLKKKQKVCKQKQPFINCNNDSRKNCKNFSSISPQQNIFNDVINERKTKNNTYKEKEEKQCLETYEENEEVEEKEKIKTDENTQKTDTNCSFWEKLRNQKKTICIS